VLNGGTAIGPRNIHGALCELLSMVLGKRLEIRVDIEARSAFVSQSLKLWKDASTVRRYSLNGCVATSPVTFKSTTFLFPKSLSTV